MFKNNSALFWMVECKIQCDFRWLQSLTPEFWLPSGSRDEPHTLKTQPERLEVSNVAARAPLPLPYF